ncbi:MAG TPA: oxidoreductase C-terminal domain-containing protein, partial [Acidimicrobiia bacterium]|nr:oxidoreductase C-terminal domain-containing protein [Acidimicrobiia bacterium]
PYFWSQHYDVPINVVGYAPDWDEVVVSGDPARRDVLVGFRKDGKIESVASIYRDLESLRAEQALLVDDQSALEDLLSDPA